MDEKLVDHARGKGLDPRPGGTASPSMRSTPRDDRRKGLRMNGTTSSLAIAGLILAALTTVGCAPIHVTTSIEVDRPVETTWDVFADADRLGEWMHASWDRPKMHWADTDPEGIGVPRLVRLGEEVLHIRPPRVVRLERISSNSNGRERAGHATRLIAPGRKCVDRASARNARCVEIEAVLFVIKRLKERARG